MRTFILLLALGICSPYCRAVELTILTAKGFVTFEAGDKWAVLAAQTKMPAASMSFQVYDPADEGTSDSTNIAVSLYDQNAPQGKKAIEKVGKPFGTRPVSVSEIDGWKIFEQTASQNGTPYTILDAIREVADVTASVRIAWPTLKGHSPNHADVMRSTFAQLLASVKGNLGRYVPKPGTVIRRPIQ